MPLHRKVFLVVMNLKNCNRIAFMVQGHDMPVIREEIYRLRIIAADRKDTDLFQESCFQIHMEKARCIVPCIRAENLCPVLGKAQGAGSAGSTASGRSDACGRLFYQDAFLTPGIWPL